MLCTNFMVSRPTRKTTYILKFCFCNSPPLQTYSQPSQPTFSLLAVAEVGRLAEQGAWDQCYLLCKKHCINQELQAWTINEPHLPKKGLDVMQSYPLCSMYKAPIHWFLVSHQVLLLHTMWAGGYYHHVTANRYFHERSWQTWLQDDQHSLSAIAERFFWM